MSSSPSSPTPVASAGAASTYDVVIAGGGPAGLSAALILGRARKRVLLCDGGTPRNATAARVQGFVTRDGTPPSEFRRIGLEQLAPYPNVEVRRGLIDDITGEAGALRVSLGDTAAAVTARRALLCTGMIDEVPDLPGFRAAWGHSIFQCPYCHGWEIRDQPIGYLVPDVSPMPVAARLEFAFFLLSWSRDLIVFTNGKVEVPAELAARYAAAGVRLEERPIAAMLGAPSDARAHAAPSTGAAQLAALELADGARVPRVALFARPPQRQVPLIARLGLVLDEHGFVRTEEVPGTPLRSTSRPGIHAAGDLTTMLQGALMAAAAGAQAAYGLNHALTMEHA
jgi:thioredoxin reductase